MTTTVRIVADRDHLQSVVGLDVFSEAETYVNRGGIEWMVWDRPTILAEVRAQAGEGYEVEVTWVQDDEMWLAKRARCSCSGLMNSWCAHAVAVIVVAEMDSEELLRERPLARRIERLSLEECRSLLMRLQDNEEAKFFIARELSADMNPTPVTIDYEAIRQSVSEEVRIFAENLSYQRHWPEKAAEAASELEDILVGIGDRLDDGQSKEAVFMLLGLTEEIVAVWDTVDEEVGSPYGFINHLAETWLDAVLTVHLLPDERVSLMASLEKWHGELSDYGTESLGVVVWVMEQGADWLPLMSEGEAEESGYRNFVGRSWLRCLDRQGDDQGYLTYSQVMGLHLEHVGRLVDLKRLADAVSYGQEYLQSERDILRSVEEIARLDREQAFQYGVKKWKALGDGPQLARRLAEMAEAGGHREELLSLHRGAWRADPSSERYSRIKELWDGDWSQVSFELHSVYLNGYSPEQGIRVLASEGKLDDLISVMERAHWINPEAVREGVLALIPDRATWVVDFFKKQALEIMNQGRNGEYQTAAMAAAYVRDGYRALNQESEWQAWKASVIEAHRRKYTLMPLIRPL